MSAPVFRIAVYDKNRVFQCQIGNPLILEATPRFSPLLSTLDMTVNANHIRVPELMADGARVQVWFKDEHLISGPVISDELVTDGVSGTYRVTVEDDSRILRQIVGWPVPTAAISSQGTSAYRTYTGNAETIVKTAVTENGVTRMAVPGLTVAPNLNRGATIPGGVPFRFHPLADKLFPAVEDAGLGVTVKQSGTSLVLDVYEPVTFPRTLSVKGRTLRKATITRTRPTASRAIIGGQGEGTARSFRQVTDATRETTYGMRAETFVDARDDNTASVMDARGAEALNEAGPKNGVSLELAGTGIFQYGPGGFHVGDRVPVKVADGLTITEVIRECTLKWVSPTYASATPVVGEITNQPERTTAKRIAALAKGQRNQEAR